MDDTVIARLTGRLRICPPDTLETGCWEWTGSRSDGYGHVRVLGRLKRVHSLLYEHFIEPVPEGRELHHQCENRACANPGHLTPVTRKEHSRIGDTLAVRNSQVTHCPQGHPYDGENLILRSNGGRDCRACRQSAIRNWYERVEASPRGYHPRSSPTCRHGHPYPPDQLPGKRRRCFVCNRLSAAAAARRKRSA